MLQFLWSLTVTTWSISAFFNFRTGKCLQAALDRENEHYQAEGRQICWRFTRVGYNWDTIFVVVDKYVTIDVSST